jgi:hypothetical protein
MPWKKKTWRRESRDWVQKLCGIGSFWGDVEREEDGAKQWVLDRLSSETGRDKVRQRFYVDFGKATNVPELRRPSWKVLCFVFREARKTAFWVHKRDVHRPLQDEIDDLFEEVGKPRPFETKARAKEAEKGTSREAAKAKKPRAGHGQWVDLRKKHHDVIIRAMCDADKAGESDRGMPQTIWKELQKAEPTLRNQGSNVKDLRIYHTLRKWVKEWRSR